MCKKSGNPVSYSAWSSGNSGFLICQIEIIFDLVLIFQRFLEYFVLKQKIYLEKLPMCLKHGHITMDEQQAFFLPPVYINFCYFEKIFLKKDCKQLNSWKSNILEIFKVI